MGHLIIAPLLRFCELQRDSKAGGPLTTVLSVYLKISLLQEIIRLVMYTNGINKIKIDEEMIPYLVCIIFIADAIVPSCCAKTRIEARLGAPH